MTTSARRETTCLILTVLAGGSRDGYGIIRTIREMSSGRVWLRAGAFYTAIDWLRAHELVVVDRDEIAGSRVRRYYRLAPALAMLPWLLAPANLRTTGASLRVGDADRDAAISALGEQFAHGRLTVEELSAHLDAAFAATTQAELSAAIREPQ